MIARTVAHRRASDARLIARAFSLAITRGAVSLTQAEITLAMAESALYPGTLAGTLARLAAIEEPLPDHARELVEDIARILQRTASLPSIGLGIGER